MSITIQDNRGKKYTFEEFRVYCLDKDNWRMFEIFPHDDIKISEESIDLIDKLYTDYLQENFNTIYRLQKYEQDI